MESPCICYTYDAAGNMLSRTDATGPTTYTYTAADQVASVTDRANRTTTFGYGVDGPMITTASQLIAKSVKYRRALGSFREEGQARSVTSRNHTLLPIYSRTTHADVLLRKQRRHVFIQERLRSPASSSHVRVNQGEIIVVGKHEAGRLSTDNHDRWNYVPTNQNYRHAVDPLVGSRAVRVVSARVMETHQVNGIATWHIRVVAADPSDGHLLYSLTFDDYIAVRSHALVMEKQHLVRYFPGGAVTDFRMSNHYSRYGEDTRIRLPQVCH